MITETLLEKVFSEIKYPVTYDEGSQSISDAEGKKLLDVRGWGWMQKFEQGAEMQDAFGNEIAGAINEYYGNDH